MTASSGSVSISALLLALTLIFGSGATVFSEGRIHAAADSQPRSLAPHAVYALHWDDAADGRMEFTEQRHERLELREANGRVSGWVIDATGERAREDSFVGEICMPVAAESSARIGEPILTLRQDSTGYLGAYLALRKPHGGWEGVWMDSRGRSGDFRLFRENEEVKTPVELSVTMHRELEIWIDPASLDLSRRGCTGPITIDFPPQSEIVPLEPNLTKP